MVRSAATPRVSNHGCTACRIALRSLDKPTEPPTSLLTKPLYQRSEGRDEDRWLLAFDTETRRLFVEHEMTRGDMRGRGYSIETDELELADYLREDGPGQDELVRLLGALFADELVDA